MVPYIITVLHKTLSNIVVQFFPVMLSDNLSEVYSLLLQVDENGDVYNDRVIYVSSFRLIVNFILLQVSDSHFPPTLLSLPQTLCNMPEMLYRKNKCGQVAN